MKYKTPSPAMVVASLALIMAAGGTGLAAADKFIDGGSIKPGSITAKQIKPGSITAKQIKKGAITGSKLAPGVAVPGPQGPAGAQGTTGATGAGGVQGPAGVPGASGVLAAFSEEYGKSVQPNGTFHPLLSATFTASSDRRYSIGFDAPFEICMHGGDPGIGAVQFRVNGALVDYPSFMFMSFADGQQVTVVAEGMALCDDRPGFDFGWVKLSVESFATAA